MNVGLGFDDADGEEKPSMPESSEWSVSGGVRTSPWL